MSFLVLYVSLQNGYEKPYQKFQEVLLPALCLNKGAQDMDTKGACPSAREVGWRSIKMFKSIQLVYSRNEPRFQLFTRTFFFLYSSAVTYVGNT